MDWIGATTVTGITVGVGLSVSQYIVLPSELAEQFTDPTLVRTRGVIWISRSGTLAHFAAVGILPWTDSNDTPPVAPDQPNAFSFRTDWIWHLIHRNFGTAEDTIPTRYEVDSKAMRRLGGSKGILITGSNDASSAGLYVLNFGIRCLVKD